MEGNTGQDYFVKLDMGLSGYPAISDSSSREGLVNSEKQSIRKMLNTDA
jgi:hypothetical protein